MSRITSTAKVRQYILDYAAKNRHHKFTRVSQETLDRVEAAARSVCKTIVTSAPSKGATL
jgi:hypothetical protein